MYMCFRSAPGQADHRQFQGGHGSNPPKSTKPAAITGQNNVIRVSCHPMPGGLAAAQRPGNQCSLKKA